VFHLAAETGTGQSMYEIHRYCDVTISGTARLLEALAAHGAGVARLILASSRAVYGEGAYRCAEHGVVAPGLRRRADLESARWEPRCPSCGDQVSAVATREDHPLQPTSPYAISKRTCEELVLTAGAAHGLETVALRYLNVYGPRQALSNPYTGVAAIFATQLMSGRRPVIFEDGLQRRDFVHVSDVVRANLRAAEARQAPGDAFNVGTGTSITVRDLALRLAALLGRADLQPDLTGSFRAGDIRHCWADVTLARDTLGFAAEVAFEDGLAELAAWLEGQPATDRFDEAAAELTQRGLTS